MFGDKVRGECFKTCDACRSRGRAEQARAKIREDEAIYNTATVDDSFKDDNVKDELDDSTTLSVFNNNLFFRSLFTYIASEIPDMNIGFGKPQLGYCINMSLNSQVGLSAKYGCA